MKILLLKDVPGTGRCYDIKEVNPGFAGNFLIPNKLATPATKEVIAKYEKEKIQKEATQKINEDLLAKNIETLKDKRLILKSKANEEGHLFAGIHKKEITEALDKEFHLNIPIDSIELEKPIKIVGESVVKVRIGNKTTTFSLVVEKE